MSILSRRNKAYEIWGLQGNPFWSVPPEDPALLDRVYYDRDAEFKIALPALYEGRNVLVRGAWGIGKTAFILTLLNRLQGEVSDLDESMQVLYLSQIQGDSPADFYRALLLALASSLPEDPDARHILKGIQGLSVQTGKTTGESKVNLGVFTFGAKRDLSGEPTQIELDPYTHLLPLLDKVEAAYGRVAIAVDDLDKKEATVIQEILEGSLELFRNNQKVAFLMTGRGFTELQEASLRTLGIFAEDRRLDPMSEADLYQIALNYLNSVREAPDEDPKPFTPAALKLVTTYAQGVPRQLNDICYKLLSRAATQGIAQIDETALAQLWQGLRTELIQELTPGLRFLLYKAQSLGGLGEDIEFSDLQELQAFDFISLLPKLRELEKLGAVIREEDEAGMRFLPSKLYEPDDDTEAGI